LVIERWRTIDCTLCDFIEQDKIEGRSQGRGFDQMITLTPN